MSTGRFDVKNSTTLDWTERSTEEQSQRNHRGIVIGPIHAINTRTSCIIPGIPGTWYILYPCSEADVRSRNFSQERILKFIMTCNIRRRHHGYILREVLFNRSVLIEELFVLNFLLFFLFFFWRIFFSFHNFHFFSPNI